MSNTFIYTYIYIQREREGNDITKRIFRSHGGPEHSGALRAVYLNGSEGSFLCHAYLSHQTDIMRASYLII